MNALIEKTSALLGISISASQPLHGGSLSNVVRVSTHDGRSYVITTGKTAKTEARMLQALRAAGVAAPQVIAVASNLLILEDLGPDDGAQSAWWSLGQELRRLHETPGPYFGWPENHAFATVEIPNTPTRHWPTFWAERRLLPSCPHIPPDLAQRTEALARRLGDLLPDHPPAVLLHGDLWTGNVMARSGRVTGLIDPSCYYGHAEVDLAMLTLFSSPDKPFWRAYSDIDPGYAKRRPIYQLWPALVHLRLFGNGYRSMVERRLSDAGI